MIGEVEGASLTHMGQERVLEEVLPEGCADAQKKEGEAAETAYVLESALTGSPSLS